MPELQESTWLGEMANLDPSPIDEDAPDDEDVVNPNDPSADKHPSYFPSSSIKSNSTSNSVGISRSRIPSALLALQKYSTIPPALYLIGHYANTAVIPLFTRSTASAEQSLLLTRPYYQSFPLEPLVIFAPIVAHVASGLSLRVYRRFQAAKRYGAETHAERQKITRALWPRLSLTSALGYALYPMMVAHVIVNRVTPLKVHGDSSSVGLRFFSYGVQRHPWLASIGYAVMVSAASWHLVGGAAKFLRLTREYVTEGGNYGVSKRKARSRMINAVAAAVASIWALGGLAVIGRGVGAPTPSIWETKQWDEVYKAVPVVGSMM